MTKMVQHGQLLLPLNAIPFSITCLFCDAGTNIETEAQAKKEGWSEIHYDDGLSWNYTGLCPECRKEGVFT